MTGPGPAARCIGPLVAVAGSALVFLAPALFNGYPLLFSDTGGFLEQALLPDMGWDKPWIYGPFLTPLHAGISLWFAAAAQCLLLSAALWLAQDPAAPPSPARHLALCAILAVATSAPWFASLIMPDILAPVAVLGLYILATRPMGRLSALAVSLLTTIAIASHLAHLVVAAASIAALALFGRRSIRRTAPPLAAALLLLLVSNAIGHGRFGISPYGADFALARLVADGPARQTIADSCPAAAWRLCAWRDRLPLDSDAFLWDPNGPVWADGYGPLAIAPEAGEIVRATLLAHPAQVAAAALRNTLRQLGMVAIGDTLVPDHLQDAVLPRLQAFFPPAEARRFLDAAQARGTLAPAASALVPLHWATLCIGLVTTLLAATYGRSCRRLAVLVLAATLANAFATGALSGPHDRYQARIAWLVILPPLLLARLPRPAPTPPLPATAGSSAG